MNESENDQEGQEEEAKSNHRSRGRKRKRAASESSTDEEDVLPENTLEVEKNLHASAIKNNLDDVSVKKILKKVVTNDHVLALVKLREEEEDSGTEENLRPKLTRAKAKELMKVSPKSAPWSLELTPIKHIPVKTRPEVKALIAQELPEDEDDEEYEPTHDEVPSDDDHIVESSSDVDSLPRTPATPRSQRKTTPKVVNDGPFKVPQEGLTTPVRRKLVLEEEATIALRTRSKLSLSATSIEHIESSFVPPDDLPMADVDSLWNDFLKDCLNPASNAKNEDDDEADPEYNVAADPDAHEEDEESLENSIIKISKKELNDLVTELFSIMPDGPTEQLEDSMVQEVLTEHAKLPATEVSTRWEGKQEPQSDEENTTVAPRPAPIAVKKERFSIGKCEPEDEENIESCSINEESNTNKLIADKPQKTVTPTLRVTAAPRPIKPKSIDKQPPTLLRDMLAPKPDPIRIEIQKNKCNMLTEQRLLLQQQLRQHVQLATSSYLQLFVHPMHWARAPVYKDYLVSFNNMVEKNPTSVVNVCNLKPALELVASWEKTVSTSTKENLEMVEFIQKEIERSRRRSAQNAYYVGDFPELYLQVVANSTVFVYPHLLPGMPFRPDLNVRRANYQKSEDELITMGLDQFWDYVFANPDIYKKPTNVHPRHRWGLAATLQLICKHMMPWLLPKTLLAHVRHVKKGLDKDNPIYKFFQSRKVEPVKHRLLQFNPQLTLYEQPEHEIPRIWIRYLAKSSNRFKKYLFSRNKPTECLPNGVDVEVNVQAPNKAPLPIDFNKKINCTRLNLLHKREDVPLVNRIDVPINADRPLYQPLIASEIFTVLNTNNGSFLVPLHVQTKTVDSSTTPICTPSEETLAESSSESYNVAENAMNKDNDDIEGTKTAERSNPAENDVNLIGIKNNNYSEHCTCCILLRNICRRKRKTILEYFKRNDTLGASDDCRCKGRRYPKMTNRLKLLLRTYRIHSKCVFEELQRKLTAVTNEVDGAVNSTDTFICDDDEHDLVAATLFHLKLTTVTAVVRNNLTKKRIHSLFSNFDAHAGDAVSLASKLCKFCQEELIGIYKEFMGFLTAEQADKVGHFKDYFIERCMEKLIKKIEELVPDKQKQCTMLKFLKSKFFTTAFQSWSACDICTALLQMMDGYPTLAQYVFSLFPHRYEHSNHQQPVDKSAPDSSGVDTLAEAPKEPTGCNAAVDYEADHSSSDDAEEDGEEDGEERDATSKEVEQFVNLHENTPVKVEIVDNHIAPLGETDVVSERAINMSTDRCENYSMPDKVTAKTRGSRKAKNVLKVKKVPKTGAERIREYRARIRALEIENAARSASNVGGMAIQTASQQNSAANQVGMNDNTRSLLYEALSRKSSQDKQEAGNNVQQEEVHQPHLSLLSEASSSSNTQTQSATQTVTKLRRHSKIAKTPAERARAYRQRKKASKNANNQQVIIDTTPTGVDDLLEEVLEKSINVRTSSCRRREPPKRPHEHVVVVGPPFTVGSLNSAEEGPNVYREARIPEVTNDTSYMSRLTMSDDDTVIKIESPEWKRDEDKVILEVLKQHVTAQERQDKTILEILEETQALTLISDSLPHKSIVDVKDRILYLLQLLIDGYQ